MKLLQQHCATLNLFSKMRAILLGCERARGLFLTAYPSCVLLLKTCLGNVSDPMVEECTFKSAKTALLESNLKGFSD